MSEITLASIQTLVDRQARNVNLWRVEPESLYELFLQCNLAELHAAIEQYIKKHHEQEISVPKIC